MTRTSKAAKSTEKQIQNAILEWFSYQQGYTVWPNQSVGIYDPVRGCFRKNRSRFHLNGVADILGFRHDGIFIAIEVKTPKGKVSPAQQEFIERVRASGGIGIVARSVLDVVKALEEQA